MGTENAPWSMDHFVLMNINSLIQRFIEADFENDFEAMYKALVNLELITSPKLDKDEVEYHLEWLKNNRGKADIIDNSTGKVVGHNPKNKMIIQDKMYETFRLILIKLEKTHIYTKEEVDLNKVMGRMD